MTTTGRNHPQPEDYSPSRWTAPGFINYLENTLIPDLKESGSEYTAEDFETAVYFMKKGGA
jgi:hypothetical protein